MPYFQNTSVELEVLASTVRRQARVLVEHQARLKEVLEAIERQDLSPTQIREQLSRVERGLKEMGQPGR